jgi:hypothetical protein
MRPVLSGSAHRFAIFRQPPCFSGRGAEEGRLRATSGLSHGQAGGLSLTQSWLQPTWVMTYLQHTPRGVVGASRSLNVLHFPCLYRAKQSDRGRDWAQSE